MKIGNKGLQNCSLWYLLGKKSMRIASQQLPQVENCYVCPVLIKPQLMIYSNILIFVRIVGII